VVKLVGMTGFGEPWIKIFDQMCRFMIVLRESNAVFKELMSFVTAKGILSSCGHRSIAYCDADISEEQRMLVFTDKTHRCDW
jgi:hypothetical protein